MDLNCDTKLYAPMSHAEPDGRGLPFLSLLSNEIPSPLKSTPARIAGELLFGMDEELSESDPVVNCEFASPLVAVCQAAKEL